MTGQVDTYDSFTSFYQQLQNFFFTFTTVLGFWRSTGKKNFLLSPLVIVRPVRSQLDLRIEADCLESKLLAKKRIFP